MSILSGEGFCELECDCGEHLGTEDNMMDACNEPFNGLVVGCPECDNDYVVEIGFQVTKIEE